MKKQLDVNIKQSFLQTFLFLEVNLFLETILTVLLILFL